MPGMPCPADGGAMVQAGEAGHGSAERERAARPPTADLGCGAVGGGDPVSRGADLLAAEPERVSGDQFRNADGEIAWDSRWGERQIAFTYTM